MSHGLVYAKRGFTSPGSTFLRSVARLGATDAWDFVSNSYMRDGRVTSNPGLTVTRASVGTAQTADGRIITFGSGVRRQTDKGLLVEGARTNLFLNSLVGETQSITVTAVAHTLSFYGTGTITLSGVSTDGPLVGTGAGQRVTLTFTPTAGSLTLTVSGTVEYVQLEVGAFASSWIPTEGASVARALDNVSAVNPSGISYPLTLFAEIERIVDTGGNEGVAAISNNTSNEEAYLYVTPSDLGGGRIRTGGADQMNTSASGALTLNTVHRIAMRVDENNSIVASNGVLSAQDTSVILPTTISRVYFGVRGDTGIPGFLYVRRQAVMPALTDAQLQQVTT